MSDPVKQALRKIRGTTLPAPKPEPLWKRLKAEHDGRIYMEQFWERDKKRQRQDSFEKAQLALEQYRETRRAEKEAEEIRQREIEKTRMKNLRKARRVLQKMREGEPT